MSSRAALYSLGKFHQRAESPLYLNGLEAACRIFADCLSETDPTREYLGVAHVDEQARCIHLTRHDGDSSGAALPFAR